jgi:hypothetical protein
MKLLQLLQVPVFRFPFCGALGMKQVLDDVELAEHLRYMGHNT